MCLNLREGALHASPTPSDVNCCCLLTRAIPVMGIVFCHFFPVPASHLGRPCALASQAGPFFRFLPFLSLSAKLWDLYMRRVQGGSQSLDSPHLQEAAHLCTSAESGRPPPQGHCVGTVLAFTPKSYLCLELMAEGIPFFPHSPLYLWEMGLVGGEGLPAPPAVTGGCALTLKAVHFSWLWEQEGFHKLKAFALIDRRVWKVDVVLFLRTTTWVLSGLTLPTPSFSREHPAEACGKECVNDCRRPLCLELPEMLSCRAS